jgi:hypothetical protein
MAKLEEEEKVKVAKLEEEKVNATELEKLKVKVPLFTKEFILVLHLHYIISDMSRHISFSLKMRRCYLSDEAYNQGGEASFSENYQSLWGLWQCFLFNYLCLGTSHLVSLCIYEFFHINL